MAPASQRAGNEKEMKVFNMCRGLSAWKVPASSEGFPLLLLDQNEMRNGIKQKNSPRNMKALCAAGCWKNTGVPDGV